MNHDHDRSGQDGWLVAAAAVALFGMIAAGAAGFVFYRVRTTQLIQVKEAELAAREAAQAAHAARRDAEKSRREADERAAESPPLAEVQSFPLEFRSGSDSASQQILATIQLQSDAWNSGDLDAFMAPYWESDELTFSSGGKTTRSWRSTFDRYRQRYPTREAMGRLEFSELEVLQIDRDAALVLGRWSLQRDTDNPGGNFTLVFRRIDGAWKIIHDHTSTLEVPGREATVE